MSGADRYDYYEILGVEFGAELGVIRQSYRRLMQHAGNHPDRGGDTKTAALINKAYAVLGNPALRAEYDSRLEILKMVATGVNFVSRSKPPDPACACVFCGQPHDYGVSDLEAISCDTCGSALQAVDLSRMESSGQRSVHRLGRFHDLTVFTHWQQSTGYAARTEDISPHGLRMITQCQLATGQRVRMVSDRLDAVGEVTHCAPGHSLWRAQTVAGVAFLTLRFKRSAGVFVARHA